MNIRIITNKKCELFQFIIRNCNVDELEVQNNLN